MRAVSYTHLDVYKRQLVTGKVESYLLQNEKSAEQRKTEVNVPTPVSYTHHYPLSLSESLDLSNHCV